MTTINLTEPQRKAVEWLLGAMYDHFDADGDDCQYPRESIPDVIGMVLDLTGLTNEAYEDFVYRLDSQAEIAEGNNRHNLRTDIDPSLQDTNYKPVNVGAITRVHNNIRRKIEKAVIADMPHIKSIPLWEGHPEDSDPKWIEQGSWYPSDKEMVTGARLAVYLGNRLGMARIYSKQFPSQSMSVSDPKVLIDTFRVDPLEVGESDCDATHADNVKFFKDWHDKKQKWLIAHMELHAEQWAQS